MFLKFKLPSCKKVERIRGIARRMDIAISVCKTAAECNELVLFSYEWNARKFCFKEYAVTPNFQFIK